MNATQVHRGSLVGRHCVIPKFSLTAVVNGEIDQPAQDAQILARNSLKF